MMMEDIKNNRFTPNIVRDGNEPKEFSSIELTQYSDLTVTKYESISEVLELTTLRETPIHVYVRSQPT